jgi:transcriptional regulator with PAS, ATPase and Fis domain
MSTSAEGRVLVSTHNLQRAGELKSAFEEASYTVDLVTPDEDVSGDAPIELLVITGAACSRSAVNLREQARNLSQAPSFAIVDDSESALHLGADYLEVFSIDARADEVVFVARSVIERRRLQALAGIVGETDAMREVLERVVQFAPVSSTVLITGESGTGKELVARGIHHLSSRRHNPFIAVNVAALSDTLLESELFGHEKGSFTGAIDSRRGLFELADRGTVFLDEIGDMPLATQTKVLRVLEQREFHRVGGEDVIRVDIRLVTATNQDLKQLVATGRFRKDLYYRLNVLHIELPPLRRRRADIPLLVEAFIADASRRHDRSFEGISPEAMEILQAHYWPGNIRELQNLVESMVVLAPGREVLPKDIPSEVRGETTAGGALIPVGLGSAQAVEPSTDQGYRPELEFVFRTLVDLRMDVDDLRQEFDSYRDGGPTGTSPAASFPSEPGKVEISVRQPVGTMQEGSWETGEHVESVEVEEVEEVGRPVVYRSGLTMEDMEREVIAAALEEVKGNRRKAAQVLAIGERTLYRKIKKFGLEEETD